MLYCLNLTCLSVTLILTISVGALAQSTVAIEREKPVKRDLKGGEKHGYTIELRANQFLYLVAEQDGIDVIVTLTDPKGSKLAEVDSPNGVKGPESIWFVCEAPGQYTVEISSLKTAANPGKYEIRIVELKTATNDDRNYAAGRNTVKQAVALWNSPDPAKRTGANEKFDQAVRLYGMIDNDKQKRAAGFHQVGRFFARNGSKEKALTLLDEAEQLYLQVGLKRQSMDVAIDASRAVSSQLDGINRHQKIIAMARELNDPKIEASSLIDIGIGYYHLGDFNQALQSFKTANHLAATIGDTGRIAKSLDNMGSAYTMQNNFGKALEFHQKALELEIAAGSTRIIPGIILNIGNVYHGLGNYSLALDSFEKALAEFEKMKADVGASFAISNIGSVYLEMGQYEEALEHFLKAQVMKARFLKDDPTSFYNIASVYARTGKHTEALEYSRKALDLYEKIGDMDGFTQCLIGMSDTYYAQKDYANALGLADRAIVLARQNNYPARIRSSYLSAANAQRGLNRPLDAQASLDHSINAIERLRDNLTGGESNSSTFFGTNYDPYRKMVDLLLSEKMPHKAFAYAERGKARTLLDVLESGRSDVTNAMTAKERELENKLRNEMVSLNTRIASTKDQAGAQSLKNELDKKRLDFEDFQTRLYATHPELKTSRGNITPITVEGSSTLLGGASSALMEYVVDDASVHLFVLTRDTNKKPVLKAYTIPFKKSDLDREVDEFGSKVARGDLDFQKLSRELYNKLLKPAADQLAGKNDVVIVPDGALWRLPFQALQNEQDVYFASQAAVSYAPSLTALREMRKKVKARKPQPHQLLAFGNPMVGEATLKSVQRVFMSERLEPLPESERLVNGLAQMYGLDKSKIFISAHAKEEVAKRESRKYRIVQFATHGILNDASPMYSHLVMAQNDKDSNEDGLLEAWEMKDLDLKADMIILSACETARGKIRSGEGVIGMTWAAFIAGAPTTVASQWKVESSSTTELMLEFHRQLLAKKKISKAEALRRASLKVMRMPGFQHPSYWAGFVIVGDAS